MLNHALLRERLRPWIARGALVAVDDAGAGFTSLEYVADIRPDFLKLSRGMVAGVDRDATREAVLRATAAFAREVGARSSPRASSAPRSSRRCARWRSTTARAGCSAARARRGRRTRRAAPRRAVPRARPRGRLERDLERAVHGARRERGGRRPPRAPRPAAGRLPRPGRAACAARPCAGSGRSTTGCPPTRRDRRARLPHRRSPRSSTTSARRPTTCPPSPACAPRSASRWSSPATSSACSTPSR